jgi:Sulfotransferase family
MDATGKELAVVPLTRQYPLTIVLGTGRCGSTMLSRLLAAHPEVLSVSEFWGIFLDIGEAIPGHDMTGAEFWERLTRTAPSYDSLVASGIKNNEKIQPFPSRFSYRTGMPALVRILNWLTLEPPDPLYDELAPVVSSWPKQPMADNCYALFAYLAGRFGRRIIVERTGGSVNQVEFLLQHFPDARYVFLHRDGPDTALSMSRNTKIRLSAFKYLAAAVADGSAPLDLETWPEEVRSAGPEEFEGLAGPPFDTERFMTYPIPLAFFGAMWSSMTRTGTREIRRVPRDRLLTLRYESLLAEPEAELTRLAGFIGVPADAQWLESVCRDVDTGRSGSAAAQLHPIELAALRSVCVSGSRAFDLLESEQAASPPWHWPRPQRAWAPNSTDDEIFDSIDKELED